METPAEDVNHGSLQDRHSISTVSVVVVTYNSSSMLGGLLDSLVAGLEGIRNFEVIVVDNDSQDGTATLASSHSIQPKVIRMGRNAGYAAGINAATSVLPLD